MIRIRMGAKSISCIKLSIHRKIQMVYCNKFLQICRTHMLLLFAKGILQVKIVNPKLIRHNNISIIRNPPCNPVMTANGLQPPDLILILKGNSIHLIGSIAFQQGAQTKYALSGTMNIRKKDAYDIFLTDTTLSFFFSILCWDIFYQRIRCQHPFIGGDGFCCRHGNIFFIHTCCRPDTFLVYGIRHGTIAHGIFRKGNLHMRQNRFIVLGLLIRLDDNKFLRIKGSCSGIFIPCCKG